MRLNHLDILEQVFRDKWRGYNKQEVDTFLHLVSQDFKEMADEMEALKRQLAEKNNTVHELQAELKAYQNGYNPASAADPNLKKQLAEKDRLIQELKKALQASRDNGAVQLDPQVLKEKAKRIFTVTKEQAELQKKKVEKDLEVLRQEIDRLKKDKSSLIQNIKESARERLEQMRK